MPGFSKINKINPSKEPAGSVDFFIYNLADDKITISSDTKKILGLKEEDSCSIIHIMSMIVGVDVPGFIQKLNRWRKGYTSEIIQIRIIDAFNQMRTVQIKGHTRTDENGKIISLYGAYFDVSSIGN